MRTTVRTPNLLPLADPARPPPEAAAESVEADPIEREGHGNAESPGAAVTVRPQFRPTPWHGALSLLLSGVVALVDEVDEAPARFVDLLHIRAFRVLFLAETQSLIGDQLARVALAALVLARTDSVAGSALSYALSYLPGILGGVVLGRIGDRLPRLPLLVGVDVVRVALFAAMALPGTPIALMLVLVSVATFVEPAFSAAQFAYLAAVLPPPMLRSATALRMATLQLAQVAGFAVGGLAVVTIGAQRALAVDATSFAVSALLISFGLRVYAIAQPGRAAGAASEPVARADERPELGTVAWMRAHRSVLPLVGLICLVGLFVVPEGLAIPYAEQIGGSAADGGLLLASMPLGAAVGAVALSRWVAPRWRGRAAMAMTVACGLPLLVTALRPGLGVTLLAWAVSGAMQAYQVEAVAQLARRVPDERRAGVMGVVGGALIAAQGLGIAVFGALGDRLSPSTAVALAGAVGTALAVLCWLVSSRHAAGVGRHAVSRRTRPQVVARSSVGHDL